MKTYPEEILNLALEMVCLALQKMLEGLSI